MVYNLSNFVNSNLPGLWNEGKPFEKSEIYSIREDRLPPVNYDAFIIKAHSITHCESLRHVDNNGISLHDIIINKPNYFYGDCLVLKFVGNYTQIDDDLFLKVIDIEEFETKIKSLIISNIPNKFIISTENYPENKFGYHKENYVLIISDELAKHLVQKYSIHLLGTSWKSSDYKPGSKERPVHKTILNDGVIFELLNLQNVPEGNYFFTGFPLLIENTSESPASPILISYDEIGVNYYLNEINKLNNKEIS